MFQADPGQTAAYHNTSSTKQDYLGFLKALMEVLHQRLHPIFHYLSLGLC